MIIEQAKGILSERHGESLQDALDRLRRRAPSRLGVVERHARSRSSSVREIARRVVEDRLEP